MHVQENKIRILTDEPTLKGALDFDIYSNTLAYIIKNSRPKFITGIFGEWGTGKNTLMSMVKEILDKCDENEKKLTVWFDAWRY